MEGLPHVMKECYPIKGCMAFLIIAFFVSEKLKIKNLDLNLGFYDQAWSWWETGSWIHSVLLGKICEWQILKLSKNPTSHKTFFNWSLLTIFKIL